ncbi:uncharacterized protein LOC133922785 [Phragmites australis]|uniref:uncharacterized protein LOC133922785 n=1 Tax=Phragmites australis TaxID=29695 RepID=UPI002D79D4D2|nr:uncharacterized protein LOC133922785 [Phragmites australis]
MAGEEGWLKRSTTKSVEVAEVSGLQGPLKRCSTKRKAKKEAEAGQMLRPLKECSTRRKAKKEEASTTVAEAEKGTGAKYRLSAKEIREVLARKPITVPPRYVALKQSNPDLTPRSGEEVDEAKRRLYILAKAFYSMQERLPKLQEWVRRELEINGHVDMDDEWVKRKAETQAVIDREWPKIQAKIEAIILSETECEDSDNSDEEEDEEVFWNQ